MSYRHDDYYDYDSSDDLTLGDLLLLVFFFCVMVGIITGVGFSITSSLKKPQGYGGSPGHMSPMEVDALYEKNENARH